MTPLERYVQRHLPKDALYISSEIVNHPFINKIGHKCMKRSVAVKCIDKGQNVTYLFPYRPKEMK